MTREQEIILLTAQITKRRRDKKKTSHLVDKLKMLKSLELAEETAFYKRQQDMEQWVDSQMLLNRVNAAQQDSNYAMTKGMQLAEHPKIDRKPSFVAAIKKWFAGLV